MVRSMLKGDSTWATGGDKGFSSYRFGTNTQIFRGEAGEMLFTVPLRLHSIVVMCHPPGWTQFPLKSNVFVNHPKETQ